MEKRQTDLWFTEYQTPDMRLGLRIDTILVNRQTPFQHILVADSLENGRFMALDGAIQVTDRDEFTYHEMMAHVILCAHPEPRRVLVVGGGDGGVVREVVKHPSVEKVFLVDIDREVIDTSREFFPGVSVALDDPRVEIKPMDAIEFIRSRKEDFDAVIVDSTDPVDFAEGLFREPFYRDVCAALRPGGYAVGQTESPFAEPEILKSAHDAMSRVFDDVRLFWGVMPTYPTGMWTYCTGCKQAPDPWVPRSAVPVDTRYYTEAIHAASFVLPPFLTEILGDDKGDD